MGSEESYQPSTQSYDKPNYGDDRYNTFKDNPTKTSRGTKYTTYNDNPRRKNIISPTRRINVRQSVKKDHLERDIGKDNRLNQLQCDGDICKILKEDDKVKVKEKDVDKRTKKEDEKDMDKSDPSNEKIYREKTKLGLKTSKYNLADTELAKLKANISIERCRNSINETLKYIKKYQRADYTVDPPTLVYDIDRNRIKIGKDDGWNIYSHHLHNSLRELDRYTEKIEKETHIDYDSLGDKINTYCNSVKTVLQTLRC